LVKFDRVVLELCERTDRQTNILITILYHKTDRDAHHGTLFYR